MGREIDNPYLRKKYREEAFDGKKSITDEYTGNRIFDSNTGLIHKHPPTKLTDGDHPVAINRIEKKYSDLSHDQRKTLANDRTNIVHTNASLNRSKGDMSNTSYVAKKIREGDPLPMRTAANMVARQAKAEINMGVKATGMRAENAFNKMFKK